MKRFTAITALLACAATIHAQDYEEISSINEIPEDFRLPIVSTHPKATDSVLDTLPTSDPRVKMILYENRTWDYIKDTSVIAKDSVMTEFWSTTAVQPYKVSRQELPYRVTLWLVDSLERFCCPNQVRVLSKFGIRHRRNHNGVDLPSPTGTPTYAAFNGRVRCSMWSRGYGNLIILRHPNGLETYYGHLSKRLVEEGEWVEAGQTIGLIGSTGHSTGPHLHFETRYKGYAFDPQWLIDFEHGLLRKSIFVLKKKFLSTHSLYTPESLEEEESIMLSAEEERIAEEKAEAERIARQKRLEAEAAAMRWHTVKSGDTLSRIAARNHTTVSAICRLNKGLTPKTTLRIGRKIRVK